MSSLCPPEDLEGILALRDHPWAVAAVKAMGGFLKTNIPSPSKQSLHVKSPTHAWFEVMAIDGDNSRESLS